MRTRTIVYRIEVKLILRTKNKSEISQSAFKLKPSHMMSATANHSICFHINLCIQNLCLAEMAMVSICETHQGGVQQVFIYIYVNILGHISFKPRLEVTATILRITFSILLYALFYIRCQPIRCGVATTYPTLSVYLLSENRF